MFTTFGAVGSSPAVGADATIYVGSNDNNLSALAGTLVPTATATPKRTKTPSPTPSPIPSPITSHTQFRLTLRLHCRAIR